MQNLSEILKNKSINRTNKKVYDWQDMASRYAEKLNINRPTTSWWKFFKLAFQKNQQGLLQSTYSAVVEIIPPNAEKYFYKVFYEKEKAS